MRSSTSLALLLLLACGPKDGSDDDSSDAGGPASAAMTTGGPGGTASTSGEDTGTPTDSNAASDGSMTVPETTTVDPTSTGGGGACAEYDDAVPVPEVKVSLRNDGSVPVFLLHVNFCAPVQLVEISGPDAAPAFQWMDDVCDFTCGEAIDGSCGACPPFCPEDKILMIAPGGTHSFAWTGSVFTQTALSLECGAAECGDSCLKVTQAADGDYTLVARASTSAIVCTDPNVCTCTPNDEGWCDVQASGIGAELRLAEGTLEYPGEQDITLVFTD